MHGGIPDTRNGGCMLAIAAGLRQHETDTLEKERAQATKRLKRGELAEKNKRDSLIDALEKFTSEDFNAEKLSLARLAVIIRWRGGEAKRLSWEGQVPEGECTSCGKGFTRSLTAGRDRAQVSEKLGGYARGVA